MPRTLWLFSLAAELVRTIEVHSLRHRLQDADAVAYVFALLHRYSGDAGERLHAELLHRLAGLLLRAVLLLLARALLIRAGILDGVVGGGSLQHTCTHMCQVCDRNELSLTLICERFGSTSLPEDRSTKRRRGNLDIKACSVTEPTSAPHHPIALRLDRKCSTVITK